MGLNRQQRRALAKRNQMLREVEDAYVKEVEKYRDDIKSSEIEQFFVAAGMALHNLYGWKANGISRVWVEMNRIIGSYQNDEKIFYQIRQELKDKANCEISWVKEPTV